jgi:hypothetical protein
MIKVTDRFYINANSNCYSLQEKTTVQDVKSQNYGQEIFKDLGYYTTIENCLKGILKITTREFIAQEQESNIKDLLKEIKLQNEFLKSLKIEV